MNFDRFIKLLHQPQAALAVLVDPDKLNLDLIRLCEQVPVACFLAGGSKLENGNIDKTVKAIKKISKKPVILFPGDAMQLSAAADGLLLLSLLSGRNAEYLIGQHVKAASQIKKMKLKVLPTAYLLVGGKSISTTQKVTGTKAMDLDNLQLILDTCLAAEQLNFGAIYLEAGSGANAPVPASLVKRIKKIVKIPIIVGGGLSTASKVKQLIKAGANMIVVGNALEKNVYLVSKLSDCFTAE